MKKSSSAATAAENETDEIPATGGRVSRRAFLGRAAVAGAAATIVPSLLSAASPALAEESDSVLGPSDGDFAILRFLAAAELIETDLWQQYNELALGNPDYMGALEVIDDDMTAYVEQNTNDELSHAEFLNAFLTSRGREPADLDRFRTLPSSPATGADQIGRLTNLTNLTVDTSWYAKYRSDMNPDLGATFPQVVNIVNRTAIPLHDGYSSKEIQAVANTAAFHFAMIEQGGSSLYDVMSLKATSRVALRIITSIGGTEVAHFSIWHDAVGDAPPLHVPGLTFPDLNANPATQTNRVMPRPCQFLNASLPLCSIIRPTNKDLNGAKAVVNFLAGTGLFIGQSQKFFDTMMALAEKADGAGFGVR